MLALHTDHPQNRYFALIITCVNSSAARFTYRPQLEAISSTLIVATIDCILLLRVWILFGKSRRLLYFMVPLISVEIGVMFFIVEATIMSEDKYLHVGPFITGCYPPQTLPKDFTLYPIPSLVVASTMFAMTIYNCKMRLGHSFHLRNTMPIVNLFLRDGIFWFMAVVAVIPPQILIWAVARPTLSELLIIPSIAVYSIIGARVILNIMEIMNVHHELVIVA
ncbi:hypothetical protein B0H16DRAFT_1856826 [Mycena metata]|uniref:Uncharacterized protein n=1 Tax=Mycena metata TaxID=1033252 RepID=A0AAD7DGQ1_9AGAR|nr:hypothetical protein B0H16DRAFT_1856826 [Mycena metata]